MRIAFLGKGGSGKTTLAAGFAKYLANQGKQVLAIDADHNMHLQTALGIAGEAKHLSKHADQIKNYIKGDRTDLKDSTMIDSTPPSLESKFLSPDHDHWLSESFALKTDLMSLLTIGTYSATDAGKTCYHGKLGILANIMHHMLDSKDDVIVSDSTAGIDTLGTSLYFAFDLTVLVVEPTQRSIDVYLAFSKIAQQLNIKTGVVVNKAEPGDESFVARFIPENHIIGVLPKSTALRKFDQGDSGALNQFVTDSAPVLKAIYSELSKTERNWDAYYAELLRSHKALAQEWYDAFYGEPISEQFDPNFSYAKVLPR